MSHGPLPPGASCRAWDCRICGQPEPSDCSHAWGPPALDRDSLGLKCTLCGVYEIPWLRWRMGDLQRSLRAAEERAERDVRKLIAERDYNAEAFVRLANAVGGRVSIDGAIEDVVKLLADRDALRARCERLEAALRECDRLASTTTQETLRARIHDIARAAAGMPVLGPPPGPPDPPIPPRHDPRG